MVTTATCVINRPNGLQGQNNPTDETLWYLTLEYIHMFFCIRSLLSSYADHIRNSLHSPNQLNETNIRNVCPTNFHAQNIFFCRWEADNIIDFVK